MSVLEERDDYMKNPFFETIKREHGDYSPFYITIAICTVIGAILFILNIVIGCCSRYSQYWNDPHTGNRWLIPLWTTTPHKQPPLELSELDKEYIPEPVNYLELKQRESDI